MGSVITTPWAGSIRSETRLARAERLKRHGDERALHGHHLGGYRLAAHARRRLGIWPGQSMT